MGVRGSAFRWRGAPRTQRGPGRSLCRQGPLVEPDSLVWVAPRGAPSRLDESVRGPLPGRCRKGLHRPAAVRPEPSMKHKKAPSPGALPGERASGALCRTLDQCYREKARASSATPDIFREDLPRRTRRAPPSNRRIPMSACRLTSASQASHAGAYDSQSRTPAPRHRRRGAGLYRPHPPITRG